jgi:hypothetical protein
MFQDPDGEQIDVAREIVNHPQFQGLFDIDSETPDADPFVIALATVQQRRSTLFPRRYVVVTEEAKAQPGRKPRIPDVCNHQSYQMECINILEMFRRDAWEFVRRAEGGAP